MPFSRGRPVLVSILLVTALLRPVSGIGADFDDSGSIDFDDFFMFADVFGQEVTDANRTFDLTPLEHGLLSDRYLDGIPENSRAAKGINNLGKRLSDELLAKLRKLNTIAQDRGQTLAQLALTWVLRHDEVVSVITVASKVSQLEQTLDVANAAPLSDDQLAAIDGVLG